MNSMSMPSDPRIAWCLSNIPHFRESYEAAQRVAAEEAANRAAMSSAKVES